ncbi:MAG: hypothetical protein MK075_07930, partial [Phycisphaerales bacterium]|nr:hypothetical protein [Phycisphaerales bacterium]
CYRAERGRFPAKRVALHPDPLSKQQTIDVFDPEKGMMQYKYLNRRTAVFVGVDRFWLDEGNCLVYSYGLDRAHTTKEEHDGTVVHGNDEDLLYWPPTRALLRGQQERK